MRTTTDVAGKLVSADRVLWTEWHRAVGSLPDNPYGVSISEIGTATALLIHGIPDPYFNRVLGVRDDQTVAHIVRFYRERETPHRFDIDPFTANERVLAALGKAGFRPAEFQTNLYGSPDLRRAKPPPGIKVREVRPDEIDFFSVLYERAYNFGRSVPKKIQTFRKETVKARFFRTGWRFYIAFADGIPAGGAVLHVRDGIGTLTGGATIYTLRGRGVQRALLLHRLEEAGDLGCDLVVSRCSVGSSSQRNMERCGLTTAYTKVIWHRPLD